MRTKIALMAGFLGLGTAGRITTLFISTDANADARP
jgi:hypothetical protein